MADQGKIQIQAVIAEDSFKTEVIDSIKNNLEGENIRIEVKTFTENQLLHPELNRISWAKSFKTNPLIIGAVLILALISVMLFISESFNFFELDPLLMGAFIATFLISVVGIVLFLISQFKKFLNRKPEADNREREKVFVLIKCERKIKSKVLELLKRGRIESLRID
tara:strand:- start:36 stop:536 length:501 start_codon:yes stop_codon:yes gene_type:complete